MKPTTERVSEIGKADQQQQQQQQVCIKVLGPLLLLLLLKTMVVEQQSKKERKRGRGRVRRISRWLKILQVKIDPSEASE